MHRMAPHIHGLMLRQIGLQKNVLNRNPSLEQQLMSGSEMAVLLCGPLEKESSPYLVVWRGNKKKVSEGKEQKSTETLTDYILLQPPKHSPVTRALSLLWSLHLLPLCPLEARNCLLQFQPKLPFLMELFPGTLKVLQPSLCMSEHSIYHTELLSSFDHSCPLSLSSCPSEPFAF